MRRLRKRLQKDRKDDDKKNKDEVEPINVELDGISDRQVRITPMSTELSDAVLDADGKTLYFISSAPDGVFIWQYDIEDDDLTLLRKASEGGRFDKSADGKQLFLFGSSMSKFPKSKAISYRAVKNLDPVAERAYMFDNIEREERERFYTESMHGVDWASMSNAIVNSCLISITTTTMPSY